MKKAGSFSLTSGNVWKTLLIYSIPLFGSALVQQLYSLVDLLVVGNFAAEGALAVDAIGNATVIINVLLSFALGANAGCAVIVAKYDGAKNNKKLRETVNTALISFSVLCAVIMAFGFGLGNVSLKLLSVHGAYYDDCLSYLYIYVGSLPFIFLYNLGCGICSALGDSKTPFLFLVLSSVLNIALDFLFVCAFHLDVAGAAWATFISQAISCILTAVVLVKKMKAVKSDEKPLIFNKRILKELTIASIPVILQQCFISIGNFFVNKRINGLDTTGDAITGFTTAFKLVYIANSSVISLTNGLSNFASQNKAANQYSRIKQGFVAILLYSLVISIFFTIFMVSIPKQLTSVFIQQEKLTEAAMQHSVQFLTIVGGFLPLVCVKIVADGAVRGCGGNLGFAISTFTDLILRVLLVYVLIDAGWGFSGVCWAWVIGWAVGAVIALGFWFSIKFLRGVKYFEKKPVTSTEQIESENTDISQNDIAD
ncbi:MAG: MATE family efflux transporter [Clostridia bacterium]|nr:MATE family efflux transporter [Clostridia bacterium]